MVPNIYIGTSGWSYKHWKGDFYPKTLSQKDWLPFYAGFFDTTEINSCFYRLPSPDTLLTWANSVPATFLFCPKMSRFLSHMKKLRDPEEPLERFFSIFDAIQDKMGPVLVQLPAVLKFNPEVTEYFFSLLAKQYKNYEFVLEVRHPSWLENGALALMKKYKVGLVISQSGQFFPYSEKTTAKNIYVRFHGPAQLYASSYSDKELESFAAKFKHWVKKGHKVWAFFNNDVYGHAPRDAMRLKTLCEP